MFNHSKKLIFISILSATIIALVFIMQGNIGFSLWDEGFLWYGSQRVLVGEVPIRDYMAYDPGRYYWSALIMYLTESNSILTLRLAISIFQWLGLFLGLYLVLRGNTYNNLFHSVQLICTILIFLLWMVPSHKLFDITLSIVLVAQLTCLYNNPSNQRYFFTGVIIGLVAIFGRNHGVYGLLGSFGLIIYITFDIKRISTIFKALSWCVFGVFIGYTPMLVALVIIPDFSQKFLESILFLTEIKGTNLSLPIPWPWHAFGQNSWHEILRAFFIGLLFIGIVLYGVLGIIYAVIQKISGHKVSPVFASTIFMTLPYAHVAYSRSDVAHLAQGIFPFLIGMLAVSSHKSVNIRISIILLVTFVSMLIMTPLQPVLRSAENNNWEKVVVGKDMLKVSLTTKKEIDLLNKLVSEYAPDGHNFLTTPFWPGAYAIFERKSPMWEIYALFPRSEKFQKTEIEKIKKANPGFILIYDYPLDGNEKLRFRNTHQFIDQYIKENFSRLKLPELPETYQIYTKPE